MSDIKLLCVQSRTTVQEELAKDEGMAGFTVSWTSFCQFINSIITRLLWCTLPPQTVGTEGRYFPFHRNHQILSPSNPLLYSLWSHYLPVIALSSVPEEKEVVEMYHATSFFNGSCSRFRFSKIFSCSELWARILCYVVIGDFFVQVSFHFHIVGLLSLYLFSGCC